MTFHKKSIAIVLTIIMSLSVFAGCGSKDGQTQTRERDDSKSTKLALYLDENADLNAMEKITSLKNATFYMPTVIGENSVDFMTYSLAILDLSLNAEDAESASESEAIIEKYAVVEANDGYMTTYMPDYMTVSIAGYEDNDPIDTQHITASELTEKLGGNSSQNGDTTIKVTEIIAQSADKVIATVKTTMEYENPEKEETAAANEADSDAAASPVNTIIELTGYITVSVKDDYTVMAMFIVDSNKTANYAWMMTAAQSLTIDTANPGIDISMKEAITANYSH